HLAVYDGTGELLRNAEATGRGEGSSIALSESPRTASASTASGPADPVKSPVPGHKVGRVPFGPSYTTFRVAFLARVRIMRTRVGWPPPRLAARGEAAAYPSLEQGQDSLDLAPGWRSVVSRGGAGLRARRDGRSPRHSGKEEPG